MRQQDSTTMRLKFIWLMQEKEYSVYTRLSLSLHIANLKTREQGDEMVKELMTMVEKGTPEAEFRKFAQEKYGVTMVG